MLGVACLMQVSDGDRSPVSPRGDGTDGTIGALRAGSHLHGCCAAPGAHAEGGRIDAVEAGCCADDLAGCACEGHACACACGASCGGSGAS